MGDLFESFLRVAMLVLIVGPLTAWIARRAARERKEATDSLEHFTVRMPAAPRVILAACAVLFELIMPRGLCVAGSFAGHLGPCTRCGSAMPWRSPAWVYGPW